MTDDEHTHASSEDGRRHSTRTDGSSGSIDDGDVSALEAELSAKNEPYARATVVRREPPASANVGDRAIVTADGTLHGWIGGVACAQSVVTEQGRKAIESGTPRLIGIAPDPETVDRSGLEAFPMTCHSEGVLELFVEPVTPKTELVIVGDSAVAQSLARLAGELALDITLIVTDEDTTLNVPETVEVIVETDPHAAADRIGPVPIVVVASMGRYDARGLATGLLADAGYLGLVASNERADEEIERAAGLLDRDPATVRTAVTNPAGVDIDAYTPAEIAASLLAEVVDVRANQTATARNEGLAAEGAESDSHEGSSSGSGSDSAGEAETEAESDKAVVDPVCGMTVDPTDAAATVEHADRTYHFCCHGCADSFENDPGSYIDDAGAGTEGPA